VELCEFLRKLGVGVTGAGTTTIHVEGGGRLHGAEHRLWGDYIEAGSWAVVTAVTGGEIEVSGARAGDMEVVASVLKRLNVECRMDGTVFRVERSQPRAAGRITTGLWPGFPSDLVSLVTVLATQAEGRTLVHDWLYELRLFALEQLSGMSADLFLCDPHRIIVTGPSRLRGRLLDSRDLRSGMALIAAALAADGQSRVTPLETVERGYAQLVDRLRGLGAQVSKLA
jgi:UDP-N-acetylglucosamine 1-carboxyvinyltransferase